jgi:hypothetical protein
MCIYVYVHLYTYMCIYMIPPQYLISSKKELT